ncbi:hypothetical protein [Kineosporia sp. A_224]|uniref:hypothetical protein n=1 Tax=Kineosporia sp. A_224 TaxID=1962180 RepID=UPI000B4A5CB5|nr:hypothetical protein [Kineosporia sp. A_224]
MRVIFDDLVHVDYGFAFLTTQLGDDAPVDIGDARAGQVNGLLGAACPGVLSLVTATHTGQVRIRIEMLDAEPALGDEWDDVVEVSFDARGPQAAMSTFDGWWDLELGRAGQHRVRLCCTGWDAAAEAAPDEDPDGPAFAGERYVLQLWPARPAPDVVLRQRSQGPAYWHGVARETPAPPDQHDLATAVRTQEAEDAAEEQRQEARWARERLLESWGGTEPDARLLAVGGFAQQLSRRDRELVDLLAGADPTTQTAVALWATRRVCAAAIDLVDWAVPLAAVEAGEPVPAPFDDYEAVSAMVWPQPAGGFMGAVEVLHLTDGRPPPRMCIDPTVSAVSALAGAAQPDPLRAALDCVEAAGWSEPDEAAYFTAVREIVARG